MGTNFKEEVGGFVLTRTHALNAEGENRGWGFGGWGGKTLLPAELALLE